VEKIPFPGLKVIMQQGLQIAMGFQGDTQKEHDDKSSEYRYIRVSHSLIYEYCIESFVAERRTRYIEDFTLSVQQRNKGGESSEASTSGGSSEYETLCS
jgi:hypothetical protein